MERSFKRAASLSAAGLLAAAAAVGTSAAPAYAATTISSIAMAPDGPAQGSTITFRSQYSGLCLDDYGYSTASGNAIVQYRCDGGQNQNWTVSYTGKYYILGGSVFESIEIVNNYSHLCLDDSGSVGADANKIQQWTCNGTAAQEWLVAYYVPDGSGPYLINVGGSINGGQVYVIDDYGYSQVSGHAVLLYHFDDGTNQRWSF